MTILASAEATSPAAPEAFFERWADMATWPDWNNDTEWVRLDGPFTQGATGRLKPKGGPSVPFVVERLVPGREFVDVSRLFGARLTFDHQVSTRADGGTTVRVTVSLVGPLRLLWQMILGKGIAATLQADADALARAAEAAVEFRLMTGWLGVVSADHVARGVCLGFAQTNHGKRSGLAKMRPGDWLVYYSPQQRLGERSPVREFTALGQIADDHIWQADEGAFQPWRRAVRYRADAIRVPIAHLHSELDLTAAPNWGYQLRRGLLPLTDRDLATIHRAMTGDVMAAATVAAAAAAPSPVAHDALW